jgi:hypothetical protein
LTTISVRGIRVGRETARLPNAMQSTKTATTIAKVKGDDPSERPPIRIRTACTVIMAKPTRSATAA